MTYCYFNGKIVKESDASISVRDVGVLRGYGVFDVLRTFGGKPFLFDAHYDRLVRCAEKLGLRVPLSRKRAYEIVNQLLEKNGFSESTIRFVVTGGPAADSIHFNRSSPTVFILISPFRDIPASIYRNGATLSTVEHQREMPEVKSLNYLTAVCINNNTKKPPFELLYTWKGSVLEASTSNFFLFVGDTLVTPKHDVLLGTTRAVVLTLAKKKYKVSERDISLKELRATKEAFLTATNKDIVPVTNIDGRKVGTGHVGDRTRALTEAFYEFVRTQA